MDPIIELLRTISVDSLKNDQALLNLCTKISERLVVAEETIDVLRKEVAALRLTVKGLIH